MSSSTISPYEILAISPSATATDMVEAYRRALKQQRYSPVEVTRAFNELRNPRLRMEYDLWTFCHLGDIGAVRKLLTNLPERGFLAATVDPLPLPLHDPFRAAVDEDFVAIPDCPLSFRSSERFRMQESALPPIQIPT